ncbi:putative glycosyltransferase (TIGR04348 family) [Halospina denitrificans]|uniref:Putative glycosyltransferase (TIGR04348 family) n=1 Tax=Halospina denitrificans TaxID=332522 RepID=A0A4R7K103_9GAMM|nr:selenoneine biosynthesis selenosugar synthase SenB [Halospina denitrificans]TDT44512.1 putative glycosyltransferase (TIGR04348 family) [Halospina denitrificans]
MRITLVTPAAPGSKSGNRATAERWARHLRGLGHRTRIITEYEAEPTDLMIALHAWRSVDAVRCLRETHPETPLIVALTGTDIYRFQQTHPEETGYSMAEADALIGLHDRVGDDIPGVLHARLFTVFQSADPLPRRLPPVRSRFDAAVIGHLREEKDSLRAAMAVRELPQDSRLNVIQLGRAHNEEWQTLAEREDASNPRFHWKGEVPRWQVRRYMARVRLMVISSVMEGGANVVSEACVAGLPVIASDIPGNIGLLGEDYPGYYRVRDTHDLRTLLLRAERDADFLASLQAHCEARAPLFTPESEQRALERVVNAACGQYG